MLELVHFKKKGESDSINIIKQIALFSCDRCSELARKLLETDNFHSYSRHLPEDEYKQNYQFVYEVFTCWLKSDVIVKPCTCMGHSCKVFGEVGWIACKIY